MPLDLRRNSGPALAALWTLAIVAAFLYGDTHSMATKSVLPQIARATGAVVLWLLAFLGAGLAILKWLAPNELETDTATISAIAVGLSVGGLISLAAAQALGVSPLTGTIVLVLLGAGWFIAPRPPPILTSPVVWGLGLLLLLPGLTDVFAPPIDTDDVYYHLALPKQMLMESTLVGGPWAPNGSRPLALHLPWTWLLAAGGSAAPRLMHWVLTGLLLLAVQVRAKQRYGGPAGALAPLLLAGSYSFLSDSGLASNNVPAAFLAWIAFDALWQRRSTTLLAIACGGAIAIKYTAASVVVPVALLAVWNARGARISTAVRVAGIASLFIVPWWLRNVSEGLHLLFPYAGWADDSITFFWVEKYGMGRQWVDFLLLPWNLTVNAEIDQQAFLGRLSPVWLVLLPPALWALRRTPAARVPACIAAVGFMLWATGAQWLRYLVPVLPIAAIWLVAGHALLPRWARVLVWCAWLTGLPANWGPILERAADHAPVVFGHEDPDLWLREHMTSAPAIAWLNEQTPLDSKVAMLFTWDAWHLDRRWVLGSVEDHVPPRYLVNQFGDESLEVLRQSGVQWVLFQKQRFLPSQYPFLSDADRDIMLNAAPETIERLLIAEGELRFESRGVEVWSIETKALPGLDAP